MKKIALVFTRIDYIAEDETLKNEHLGLAYLAGNLKRMGYQYDIIDGNMFDLDSDKIAKTLIEGDYGIVGFSVLYPNYAETQKVVDIIYRQKPNINILLGGQHVTFCDEEILKGQKKYWALLEEKEN